MSFFLPIVLGVGTVLLLVFGTRKTIESHIEPIGSRPSYLGGDGANTGTEFDRDYERYRTEDPLIQQIEKQAVDIVTDIPDSSQDTIAPTDQPPTELEKSGAVLATIAPIATIGPIAALAPLVAFTPFAALAPLATLDPTKIIEHSSVDHSNNRP